MKIMTPPRLEELIGRSGAIQMEDIIKSLFNYPPRMPCSYDLQLHSLRAPVPSTLMSILVSGTRILYGGQNLKIFDISEKQFQKLNEYMESIGYTIKYKPHVAEGKLVGYNIWFEPFSRRTRCNGLPMF
jgi:hypothetical protein